MSFPRMRESSKTTKAYFFLLSKRDKSYFLELPLIVFTKYFVISEISFYFDEFTEIGFNN